LWKQGLGTKKGGNWGKRKKKEMGEAPYLGSLTSGAPDLEGKNRKKEKRNKRVIKKGTGGNEKHCHNV